MVNHQGVGTRRRNAARRAEVVVVAVDGTGDGLFVMPVAPVLPTSEPSSSSARSVISDGDRARLSGWHARSQPRVARLRVVVVAVVVCAAPPPMPSARITKGRDARSRRRG